MKKTIPIIRRVQLNDGNIASKIVGAINKQTKKIEIPEVKTVIEIAPGTKTILYTVAGLLGGSLVVFAIINHKK